MQSFVFKKIEFENFPNMTTHKQISTDAITVSPPSATLRLLTPFTY